MRNASATKRVLITLSDMRHSTKPFDIETPKVIPVAAALKSVEANRAFADLRGVDVYCLGVHAVGKDMAYWRSLREFWTQYFARSGANLKCFSMERDVVERKRLTKSLLNFGPSADVMARWLGSEPLKRSRPCWRGIVNGPGHASSIAVSMASRPTCCHTTCSVRPSMFGRG